MGVSDFCMNPVSSCGAIVGQDTETYNILSFYSTCTGTGGPFNPYVDNIFTLNGYLNETMNSLEGSVSQQCFDGVKGAINQINFYTKGVYQDIQCPEIYNDWSTFMYSGVCDYFFNGIVNVWVVQLLEVVILFVILCIGSVTQTAFVGFEEDRATNGALNDWVKDIQSFAPTAHVVKLTPEEMEARLQATRKNRISGPGATIVTPLIDAQKMSSIEETKDYNPSDKPDVETAAAATTTPNPLLDGAKASNGISVEANSNPTGTPASSRSPSRQWSLGWPTRASFASTDQVFGVNPSKDLEMTDSSPSTSVRSIDYGNDATGSNYA
jgi:hypothetical protein